MINRRLRRGPSRRLLGGTAAVTLTAFALLAQVSQAAWTAGSVLNSQDTVAVGSLAFTHSYPSGSCGAGPAVTEVLSCAGTILPNTPTLAAPGTSVTGTLTNTSTIPSAGIKEVLSLPSCAPVKLDNSRTAADPMLPRSATTFQAAGPTAWGDNTTALSLDGTAAYASDVVGASNASAGATSYSSGIWFRVANGYSAGGGLISLDVSPTTVSTETASRIIWLDNAGKVRFSVTGYAGLTATGVSPASYNNGAWHLAVLSVDTPPAGWSRASLVVDGIEVASALGSTYYTPGSTSYWHAGWGDFAWPLLNAPTSAFLKGSVAGAFTTDASMTTSTAASLYAAGSAAAYAALLGSATNLWMMGDTGLTTYTGALPVLGNTSACESIDIYVTFNGSSVSRRNLVAFLESSYFPVPPGPGSTQTIVFQTQRSPTYSSYVTGLYLYAPIHLYMTTNPASNWRVTLQWDQNAGRVVA